TGVFTDNQPDFTWLQPYESKRFTQYFMPYKELGQVKNATVDAMVNLELDGDRAVISVYTTGAFDGVRIVLAAGERTFLDERVSMAPAAAYHSEAKVDPNLSPQAYQVRVIAADGRVLVAYRPEPEQPLEAPPPAKAALPPA